MRAVGVACSSATTVWTLGAQEDHASHIRHTNVTNKDVKRYGLDLDFIFKKLNIKLNFGLILDAGQINLSGRLRKENSVNLVQGFRQKLDIITMWIFCAIRKFGVKLMGMSRIF